MIQAARALLTVAEELAEQAKGSMPKLLDGEQVVGEYFENGIYTRKTMLCGKAFVSQYDFRQKAVRRAVEGEGGVWQSLT